MEFLTIKDVAKILSVSPSCAKELLKSVPCIDLGKGRGKGKRYLRQNVEDFLLSKIHTSTSEKKNEEVRPGISRLSPSEFLSIVSPTTLQ